MSIPCWPIPGCEHPHPEDGCCTHPDAQTPECNPHACPLNATHRLPLKDDMVAARRAKTKDVTRRVITNTNSTVDGARWAAKDWKTLDLANAWVDPACMGGSPCLKVPMRGHNTVHRVRPIYQPGDLLLMGEKLVKGEDGVARYAHDNELVRNVAGLPVTWRWVRPRQPSVFCPAELVRDMALAISCGPVRLQEIKYNDVLAEGLPVPIRNFWLLGAETVEAIAKIKNRVGRMEFKRLWDSINGPRGHPWKLNEFVWRLEMTKFGDPLVKEVCG